MSPCSRSNSRTTGSAWPQYGHSKSPYSSTVTGASSGPRMWSRSGSTGSARSTIKSGVPSSIRIRRRRGIRFVTRTSNQVSVAASSAALRTPTFASSSSTPWKARSAMRMETVKPIPAIVPAAPTDAQPTGGRRRPWLRRVASQVDAGVGEREERDNRVARPGMPEALQPLVRRDGRPQRAARRAGEVPGWLLAEEPEEVGRALEVAPLRRVGERDQATHQAGHNRTEAGLVERDPDRRAHHEVDRPEMDVEGANHEDAPEQADRHHERYHRDRAAVCDRDHEERHDVVDDCDCEQEGAQAVREPGADERDQAERECCVSRHRRSPAMRRAMAGIQRQVDRHRHHHPADPCEERKEDSPPLAQLAEVELAPGLEPDHEEEEGHQTRVDPAAAVLGDA